MTWLGVAGAAVWGWLRAAGKWLADHPIAIAGLIGAALGAYLMWRSKRNQIATLAAALEVQAHRRAVAETKARAELLEQQSAKLEPEAKALRVEIATRQRRIVEIHDGADVAKMTDDEVAKRFAEAGL